MAKTFADVRGTDPTEYLKDLLDSTRIEKEKWTIEGGRVGLSAKLPSANNIIHGAKKQFKNFNITATPRGSSHIASTQLVFTDGQPFKEHFYHKDHVTFFSENEEDSGFGSVIVSFEVKHKHQGTTGLKGIIRSKLGTKVFILPYTVCSSYKKMLSFARTQYNVPATFSFRKVKSQDDPELEEELLRYEQSTSFNHYKFGVLYVKAGQKDEDDMFANVETSNDFEEFCDFLGDNIVLMGWNNFRGGLDVKTNTTGTHSRYTVFQGFEIMYHVSTLLPYQPNDKQRIERKRHIGNDVVVIIFKDGRQPFDPSVLTSHFNHVFVVVESEKVKAVTRYKIVFTYKPGAKLYGPHIPFPPVFEKTAEFRDFLLTKLINAELGSMHAPDFKGKLLRTYRDLLGEITLKYSTKARSRRRRDSNIRKSLKLVEADPQPARLAGDSESRSLSFSTMKLETSTAEVRVYPNGDSYIGPVNTEGERDGKGKYIFANGDIYEGEFRSNIAVGFGQFIQASGESYKGDFQNHRYHGKGICTYLGGDSYEGEFREGLRVGQGVYRHASGNVYEGTFLRGKIDGKGKYKYVNGDTYDGEFKDGLYHGQGTLLFHNGDKYIGQFDTGLRHGKGRYIYASGSYYEGEYIYGVRDGYGVFVDTNEDRYEGEFRNGKANGHGKFKFHNGDTYEGGFKEEHFHGFGKYIGSNGRFEGEYVDGSRNGKGKFWMSNGDIYEGDFRENVINGEGSYTWSANGATYSGEFRAGKPHGRGKYTMNGQTFDVQFDNGKQVPISNNS